MRTVRRFTFMLLAASLMVMSSGRALPGYEVDDTYYDCALNEVGERSLSCGGHLYTSGQQSGAYRFHENVPCDNGTYTTQWYYWSGTGWVAFSGPPGPNC